LILDRVCATDIARLPATGTGAADGTRGAVTTSLTGVDMGTAGSIEAPDVAAATALTVNLLGTVTMAAATAPRRPGWLSAAEDDGDGDALSAKAMKLVVAWRSCFSLCSLISCTCASERMQKKHLSESRCV
jgi:hypothetical protein